MVMIRDESVTPTERQYYQQRMAQLETALARRDAQRTEQDQRVAAVEAQFAELQTRFAAFREQYTQLLAQNAKLLDQVAKLSKNSSNSSKPPSSDITGPPKPPRPDGPRRTGGQPGHPGTTRTPVPPERVDRFLEHHPETCPRHGVALNPTPTGQPKIQQVIELADQPVETTEHRSFGHVCPVDGEIIYAPLPNGVLEGPVLGPRLMALIGYMKGGLHTTYTGLEDFFREVLGVEVSRATLCTTVGRVSETLRPAYEELREYVPAEPVLHVDETGWNDNGQPHWLWVFATATISFFVLARHRSSQILKDVLGQAYSGTLVSDFFSVYTKYANRFQQFCLAHLIRDVKFQETLPDPAAQAFGKALLTQFRRLFHFWHLRQTIPKERFDRVMRKIQTRILALADSPDLPKPAATLARRIRKHDMALFRFLFDPAVPPTNNAAERAIRHSVLDQRLTQGSRSERGRRWNERVFTVLGTCRKQDRSAWQFLFEALSAHYFHTTSPSLIPQNN